MSRTYLNAGHCIDAITTTPISLKSYISKKKIGKEEYALIINTIKYQHVIDTIIHRANVNAKELGISYGIMMVMIYEILFGSGDYYYHHHRRRHHCHHYHYHCYLYHHNHHHHHHHHH